MSGNSRNTKNRTIVGDNLILNWSRPKVKVDQVTHKMLVHADKLPRKHSSCVDVRGEWFERLVVA